VELLIKRVIRKWAYLKINGFVLKWPKLEYIGLGPRMCVAFGLR
jgi:hypothetical protein